MRGELRTVAETLQGIDYVRTGTRRYTPNPAKRALERLLGSLPQDADVVIAYYTGHGYFDGLHYLVTKNSTVIRPPYIDQSAVETRRLPQLLRVRDQAGANLEPQPHLLIMIDTCFAGAAAREIALDALSNVVDPERTWVMVSARDVQWARQRAFAEGLKRALAESTAGRKQRYLSPDVVADAINLHLDTQQEVRVVSPTTGVARVPPFFPSPEFAVVPSGLTLAEQGRWLSPARRVAARGTGGYRISGKAGPPLFATSSAGSRSLQQGQSRS